MQRRQALLGDRFAKVLLRQCAKRRQCLFGLWSVGNQPNGVTMAHLQKRNLVKTARIGALALFFQHQLGIKGGQRFRQPRRRSGVQAMRVLHRPTDAFPLCQR
ncbi:hypothetical protein D3C81_1828830 [compost metagenome]